MHRQQPLGAVLELLGVFPEQQRTVCVPVSRVHNLLEKRGERALRQLFSRAERSDCETLGHRSQRYASRVAAKLALRALLPAARSLPWAHIEVWRRHDGVPELRWFDSREQEWKLMRVKLSLSHTERWGAAAVVGMP